MEKEITVLNHPLPSREDLSALLDKIITDVKQFKQVKIDLDDAGRERLLQAALGLTLGEAENVFAKIIVKDERLSGDDVNEVFAALKAGRVDGRIVLDLSAVATGRAMPLDKLAAMSGAR